MVLLVPDTELEDDISSVLEESESESKAELDAEELAQDLPKEQQKVELDLEDAPFLDDDEDEEDDEEEEEAFPVAESEPKEDSDPWYKRRKIIIPAAAGLLLVIVAIVAWLFMSSDEQAEEPAPPVETETVESEVPPPPPPEPEVQEFLVPMAPFWVEHKDDKGAIRFLVCQFTGVTTNEKLSYEMTQKTTILRDAIYYYLRNKDLTFLSDKKNAETLKSDILSVVNQYLSVDRLEQLLIEQYLVK